MSEEKRYTVFSNGLKPVKNMIDFLKEQGVSYKLVSVKIGEKSKVNCLNEGKDYYEREFSELKTKIVNGKLNGSIDRFI